MKAILLLLVLITASLAGTVSLGGCQHELFMDANDGPGGDRRIKTYWDDDSAVQTRESRRKASEMGFGYPQGMFNQ